MTAATTRPKAVRPEPRWDPPGRGSWSLDLSHYTRPLPPISADAFTEHFVAGLREGFAESGLLLDTIDYAVVNGFAYTQPRVVGAPAGAPTPPKPVFQLLTRLHPVVRARTRTAARLWERKPWRSAARDWQHEVKPSMIRAARALQDERVRDLPDDALLDHLDRAVAHLHHAVRTHGRYTVAASLPLGDLVVHLQDWLGLEPAATLAAAVPVDREACGRAASLAPAAEAVRNDVDALAALDEPTEPASALAAIEATSAGAAVRAWLDEVGLRLAEGYDLGAPTLLETPQLLVAQLRAAVRREAPRPRVDTLRDAVPAERRAELDRLLAEVALVHDFRDERVLYCDVWANGILRRGLLEAGRRLTERGRIGAAEHLLDARVDEVRTLFAAAGPLADVLADRHAHRTSSSVDDAPRTLGGTAPAPPPADWLPKGARRAYRVTNAIVSAIFDDSDREQGTDRIVGIGVSPGTVDGVARVLDGPGGLDRIRPGDVLVTRTTSPAFNAVLPLLTGVVTDRGGALSHAAIVAREYGIPGVVGTREATSHIPDGARIRVDGTAGEVMVLR